MNRLIFVLIVFILFCGCSRNGHVSIELPEDKRLEETRAGWWIKELNLSYNNEKSIVINIRDKAEQIGVLLDSYSEKDKKRHVLKWRINGRTQSFVLLEKIYLGSEGAVVHFVVPSQNPEGILWTEIVDRGYKLMNRDRRRKHGATITSKRDKGARLFLFGWGDYCTSINLMH